MHMYIVYTFWGLGITPKPPGAGHALLGPRRYNRKDSPLLFANYFENDTDISVLNS